MCVKDKRFEDRDLVQIKNKIEDYAGSVVELIGGEIAENRIGVDSN